MSNKLKVCQAKRYNESPCGRPLYDDKHCIFHSKDIEGKKEEFEKAFWEEFKRQEKEDDVFDFTGFIFPEDISFELQKFKRPLLFVGAKFQGKADFREARFSKEVDFELATFSEKADFSFATFSNLANFSFATFSNLADFSFATFSNETYFYSTEFSKIILTNTYFEDVEGLFERVKKEKRIFKIFKIIKYKIDDFRFILGPKAEAKYPIIAKKAKDAYFLADFKNQHPIIYWLWNITSKCGQSLARWALVSLLIALLFGAIYADYSCPSWLQWMNLGNWMEKVNPIMAIDQTKVQELGIIRKTTWFTPYYFSIVTFTTLGFGDVTPVNLAGEIWLALEVILGYIMLGGLISIFANKLARRS